MLSRVLGKLFWSILVLVWAIWSLIPPNDRPFNDFVAHRSTAQVDEFSGLLSQAKLRVQLKQSPSVFVALKEIAKNEKIDLSSYFSDIKLQDIKNLDKKNKILLETLLRESNGRLKQGLDLKGGISFTLKIADQSIKEKDPHLRESQLEKAAQIMRQRLDGMGVAEPVIRARGSDEIEIQLPGISTQDNPEIVDAVKRPAKLEFRLVHEDRPHNLDLQAVPIGYELLFSEFENQQTGEIDMVPYYVKKIPEMTGKMVKNAHATMNQYGGFEISLEMKSPDGVDRFARITKDNIGRSLGIVLDGKLYSAPRINCEIPNGMASISGHFSQREALELANVLNNPLEFELILSEIQEIGPSLAEDAKTSSMHATILGVALVILFMVIYYRASGWIAVISVLANVLIVLGCMAMIGATMTLPGVAALVLTVGMGVDSNILILERIREELALGKRIYTALIAGYDKAFSTIFDANITSLLSALILIWLGTGPVRGFGVILAIGIFATMFCALVLSRALMAILIDFGFENLLKKHNRKVSNFDFLGKQKIASILSIVVIGLGLLAFVLRGNGIYGIDFTGGDEMTLQFAEKLNTNDIERLAKENDIGEVGTVYRKNIKDSGEVLCLQTKEGKGKALFQVLNKQYPEAQLKIIHESSIGSSVSGKIKWNAICGIVVSLLMVLIYVALRFEIGFGMGALISTIHDVLATIGIYLLLGGQFSAPMIGAILMIIGYSINDTIVVFDRIREELHFNPETSLKDIINYSVNCTLSRTILTSLTTLLAALALYCFGAGAINDLALIFIIGIFVGTYSSIFIASPIFYRWHKGDRRTVEIK
ncbi:MAG: protein translocase subunit SecD [Puniceicoccales bacterium]|jgi:SecD/SecF fusion protein|nr:protein translocase subunit SecD [Puniceicoccales bacterium]